MNHLPIEIPMQPDFSSDVMLGSDALVDKLYEPLRRAYPNYISRAMIGTDTSGQYPMWLYDFCPEHYEACVFLQSGVHPIETEGYLGLARIMEMIANSELPELRARVRFLVIPIVSVYGVSKKAEADSIIKRYDIPHNLLGINSNRDCYERRLSETQNVLSVIEKYKDVIDFAFDLHTTTTEDWGDYLTVYPDHLPHQKEVVWLNDLLRSRNVKGRPAKLVYCGSASEYPTGSNAATYAAYITEKMGIPTCTLEHSDFAFDSALGTSIAITRAVELYLNHIMLALNFYKKRIANTHPNRT